MPAVEPGARVLASFGIVDPIKQPHKVLRCFAASGGEPPGPRGRPCRARQHRAGRQTSGALGEALGLDGRLFITGRVEAEVYLAWLRRAELAVQLRASFSGEASAAVGDCLACGVPMIVSDIGWMGELPDDVAVKVPVDVTAAELAEACRGCSTTQRRRASAQQRGPQLRRAHSFEAAARALLDILDETSAVAG